MKKKRIDTHTSLASIVSSHFPRKLCVDIIIFSSLQRSNWSQVMMIWLTLNKVKRSSSDNTEKGKMTTTMMTQETERDGAKKNNNLRWTETMKRWKWELHSGVQKILNQLPADSSSNGRHRCRYPPHSPASSHSRCRCHSIQIEWECERKSSLCVRVRVWIGNIYYLLFIDGVGVGGVENMNRFDKIDIFASRAIVSAQLVRLVCAEPNSWTMTITVNE